ncbi:uncharacterized protein LOC132945306 isoform X4 [Metopolophium dirhodum]|uniref:uncharacterized protein LOC132945306 isoform X4 n=1 Tax=Metopolophium dirhodum TaxID=44670 RepID=UPI0029901E8B|nr:uncharacterized protein LOC132945306 isoform X4 [Metopolophium dirhodum]
MESERSPFPLLNDTLNYLDIGITGKIKNIVRNKYNTFIFHLLLQECEYINNEDMNLALLNEPVIPLYNVQPGSLLACLHPQNKTWMRCYVVSILHHQANVAFCETGELTKTKKLKDIPEKYKHIPVITFEAEVKCICPYGKLQHLMENFKEYNAKFEPITIKPNNKTYKTMKLFFKTTSIEFIIKNWDLQKCVNSEDSNYNSIMFKNGSSVVIAKVDIYDWRHIFVRSVDHFVNVCKQLQIHCGNAPIILRNLIAGDIVAVKCTDKFYRCKVIDLLKNAWFSLYLIDNGCVISASIDCIVDLPDTLKKIPPTVCLVGLKDITLKPWTPEMFLYFKQLFENSTSMVLEYPDHNPFGLDSVTLTIINNNEDVNERIKELLKFVEDPSNDHDHANLNNCVHDSNKLFNLQSNTVIPVKVDSWVKSAMPEQLKCSLPSGSIVYMTGVVDLKEIYIRKLEDHDDDHEKFLDMVNEFCLSAVPINRPLVIGEIVGAQSTIDDNFYRGKVLKKIDDVTYSLQFIDFGDKDNVPSSKIFEIPKHFMTPSNVIKITLKGVNDIPLNVDALNYVSNLLSTCEPMIIEFSPVQPLKDVSLTTVSSNENVNKRLNELLNNDDGMSTTDVKNQLEQDNVNIEENTASNRTVPGLKKGDSVYITTFINVHNCFVRKVEDDTDELSNFIENVNLYCSAETPIGKLPKLNDLIGAKSIDGSFYRGKVTKKVNDNSYDVHFIDFGMDENVSLSDIVNLSTELKQVIPSTILVKLKNVSSTILNEAAREYVTLISEKALIIDMIEDNTNEVILKTEENESVNDRLKELMFENIKEININDLIEIDEEFKSDQSLVECNVTTLKPGSIVYLTAFVNMDEMYIRKLEDYNDEFHNLLDKVNEFCLSAKPINRPLIIGQIVGAQSTLDDSFYRGKVLKKIDDFTYSIQFIDFGDKDNVPLSKTFEIPTDFMVPSTIMEINLKGIKSHSLSIEASNYITNLLSTYEPLSIDFDNQFPIKDVTLVVIKNNENVAENLNKLLKDENSTTTINIVEDERVKEDELTELPDIPKSSEVTEPKLCDETNILKNGDIVFITSYIDLYNIFVRKLEDNNVEFQNLIESVNTYCISENTSKSKSPELNEIVGAKSSVDGYFYRAKIVEKTDENTYETIFIDYGFEESVNIANIVPLPIQLQQVTPTITLVGLIGASFENLNSESHNYLENLMLLSEPMKIEFEDLTKVKLTVIGQKQNVIDHLNELNVDNTTVENTIINNSLQLTSGMKYISNDITVPPIPPLTNKCIITIHAFISLKDIYISVPFNKAEVDKFLKDFSVYCLTLQPITRNPAVGEVLGIRLSTNNSFNRGVVEEKLNENQYKVVLFDLGTKDIVSANSFVEIPEHLQQVPRTIYSIRLKDIDSGILNTQAMSYVNMLCENLPLIIEFDEESPNGLNAVTLTTIKTQQNVNNHLIKLLTLKERDSPETVQMLSKGDIVYISTFVDLHAIYVRRINNGTDKFKSFLENFSSSCALESPIKNDPKVGAIIAAREQGGNKFYRAEVISRVDNDNFNVCFIDFGYWDTVHKSNMVQPSESQLQNCPPTFMVGLLGLDAEPANATILHYIENISQTDTFIIDSITELNKVVLISANTQCNINKEIKNILGNGNIGQHIKNGVNANGDKDTEKCVIKYYRPPLDVATQVWVADKISPSRYSVHTSDSRLEFIQLENQIFEDSKTFESAKSVSVNMPCIVYFSPSWYRGVVLEVIDQVTAKVGLVDVGNFSVVRSIKEIFRMPSKYEGKSLLVNIEIQPEPQEKLAVTSFRIVAKKHLDNVTVVEVLLGSTVDQSYDDLVRSVQVIDNVGLPSFSSTPIPEDSAQFQFNNSRNEQNLLSTTLCQEQQTSGAADHSKRFSNMLTIKDVQYARWLKGAVKTLTFLCVNGDCLMMRDHLIDDTLADLEAKIQEHCVIAADPLYTPAENELCLAKYFDELWYRAICVKAPNDLVKNDNDYMVYFLDWGMEYLTKDEDIKKMPKDFIYLPATAHKCYVKDAPVLEWSAGTMHAVSELGLKQLPSTIDDKLSNDSYMISCAAIKDLFDKNLQ